MTGFPQPHCNSYYAATTNITTDYPPPGGADNCDVCIVGAGFTGISAALQLAERGYKVIVLEANRVSRGASAGTYERFDIFEKVKHYRIPGGQWVGNQLLALGMIYFRLLDLL